MLQNREFFPDCKEMPEGFGPELWPENGNAAICNCGVVSGCKEGYFPLTVCVPAANGIVLPEGKTASAVVPSGTVAVIVRFLPCLLYTSDAADE